MHTLCLFSALPGFEARIPGLLRAMVGNDSFVVSSNQPSRTRHALFAITIPYFVRRTRFPTCCCSFGFYHRSRCTPSHTLVSWALNWHTIAWQLHCFRCQQSFSGPRGVGFHLVRCPSFASVARLSALSNTALLVRANLCLVVQFRAWLIPVKSATRWMEAVGRRALFWSHG